MKRSEQDKKLAGFLKSGARQAQDNQWFTMRVLNKLPVPDVDFASLGKVCYAIAFVVTLACWYLFLRDFSVFVITVRDILHFTLLAVLSLTGLWSGVRQFSKWW